MVGFRWRFLGLVWVVANCVCSTCEFYFFGVFLAFFGGSAGSIALSMLECLLICVCEFRKILRRSWRVKSGLLAARSRRWMRTYSFSGGGVGMR